MSKSQSILSYEARTGHRLYECDGSCQRGDFPEHCNYCQGGLALCVKCRGAEGSLPTHCPGRHMTSDEEQAVMDGTLDYKGGQWTVQMVPEAETVAGRPRPRLADLDKMI